MRQPGRRILCLPPSTAQGRATRRRARGGGALWRTWWRDSATTFLSGSTCITAAHRCFWSRTAATPTDLAIVSSSLLSWGSTVERDTNTGPGR